MIPYWQNDGVVIWQGDCRAVGPRLKPQSIQAIITSPPYWNLRDYRAEPQVWDGVDGCEHEWGNETFRNKGGHGQDKTLNPTATRSARDAAQSICTGNWCQRCGAWRGSLGLEPTPDMFIAHLVACFEALRPAMRDDGTLWVNIGDSYVSHGIGKADKFSDPYRTAERKTMNKPHQMGVTECPPGLQPGDLCGIPHRFAEAMQAAGWKRRADIVWAKGVSFCPTYSGSVMPESVSGTRWERHRVKMKNHGRGKEPYRSGSNPERLQCDHNGRDFAKDAEWLDCPGCEKCAPHGGYVLRSGQWRPTRGYEMLYLFTKGDRYFCDGENGREAGCFDGRNDTLCKGSEKYAGGAGLPETTTVQGAHERPHERWPNGNTRNIRNVWAIGTQAFKGAHFATFPQRLVEPIIRIATPDEGVCPTCGAPWARVVETTRTHESGSGRSGNLPTGKEPDGKQGGGATGDVRNGPCVHTRTITWRPTCDCYDTRHCCLCHKELTPEVLKTSDSRPCGHIVCGECADTVEDWEHECDMAPVPALVCDPFCGSGTMGYVAAKLGQNFVGCELSKPYCDMAIERIKEAQNRLF